jgi:hypothetical protein
VISDVSNDVYNSTGLVSLFLIKWEKLIYHVVQFSIVQYKEINMSVKRVRRLPRDRVKRCTLNRSLT